MPKKKWPLVAAGAIAASVVAGFAAKDYIDRQFREFLENG